MACEQDRQTDGRTNRRTDGRTWFNAAGDVSEDVGCVTAFCVRRHAQLHRPVFNAPHDTQFN